MKNFSVAFGTVAFLLLPFLSVAQIQVSFPTSRAVFQRDNANQATFRVNGYYTSPVTRIEARLQVREGGRGTAVDWQTIQANPSGGVFAGDIRAQGGWYNLEVRGMNGDQQVGAVTPVERVGVGEVFIIAGQSNAQGIHQRAPNPGNDLVNCVNERYPDTGFPLEPPVPVFSKVDNTAGFTIAPRGLGSWCWGQLGDLLVKRLNVPVMFFNAAYTGTFVRNWRESAPEGGVATGYFNQPYQGRQPYINLKIALQFYASTLGVRAILWHQGEADNLVNTPVSDYVRDLQLVISQTGTDFGRSVPWVVSRASYGDGINGGVSNSNIVLAQNTVIGTTANVFAGPETDNIQVKRMRPPLNEPEGLHFDSTGLVEVASAWNGSLSDSFFQRATPVGPVAPPAISVACGPNNALTLAINGNFPTVQWDSGESGSSVTKGAGTYRAKVKDAQGNTFFTGQVRVSTAPAASVVDNRPPSICIGSSLALTANYDNVTWFTQQSTTPLAVTRTISTTSAGGYFVRYRDVSGCDFQSNVVNAVVNLLPTTPVVSNDRPTTFCLGDATILRASNDNVQYNWSDGQKGKLAPIGTSGSYFVSVTDQNGCTSPLSNTVVVTANPVPAKPSVAANGPLTFCADRTVTLTAPEDVAYEWTGGQTARIRSLTVNQSGNYSVRTTNQFGCTSVASDVVSVNVNPLPQTPAVSAAGAITFCEGNRVTLNATSNLDVVWSSGQTDKAISVSATGNYTVQSRDQNGCLSRFSSVIAVKANPLPATPTIQSSRPPTICEGDRITLRVDGPYTVFWNTGDSTRSISTGQAETYSARIRDVNGCISAQPGTIRVELRPLPPAPTINQVGTYTLEAVSSTNGTEFRWRRGTDSLAAQTAAIKANQSGTYTARSSIIYSPTLTCFSVPSAAISFVADAGNRGLSIYPNPNPDKIVVLETQVDLVNATVMLYSLTGQVVLTTVVPSFNERKQLVLTGLASGPYILRVQAAGFDVSKRIQLGL